MSGSTLPNRPIVSICIPTYNRAHCIKALFESLHVLKQSCRENVEVCVSNNNSSDSTADVINEWRLKLDLRVTMQTENIGATRNFVEVTKLASGRWIHLVGDDDTLLPLNYLKLLEALEQLAAGTWVLAEVEVPGTSELHLQGIAQGVHTARRSKLAILKLGLSRFGFMGKHLIPATHLTSFHTLPTEAFIPWPHLGLLLGHLGENGEILVWRRPLVTQAGGGSSLFWRADDWARLHLSMLQLIQYASMVRGRKRWYYNVLILRELYGIGGLKIPAAWKVYETATFNERAIREYAKMAVSLGWLAMAVFPYVAYIGILRATSPEIVRYTPLRARLTRLTQRYADRKRTLGVYEGVMRKL